MMRMKSAVVALTAALCAMTMTASAEARGLGGGNFGGGHFGGGHSSGGHFGHAGHFGHGGWGHGGWGHGHHHHGWGPGFGFYEPYYSSYYDDDDCYRVYRYHRWRVVCDD